jgi:RHS repeat-associated protein
VFTGARAIAIGSDVAVGAGFTVALRQDLTVWTWGFNNTGQLGRSGCEVDYPSAGNPYCVRPGKADLTDVVAVSAFGNHVLALRVDGTVVAWGRNSSGQLGDGTTTDRTTPQQVPGLSDVIAIAAGYEHSLALTAGGTLYAWGGNDWGQLGDGTANDRYTPAAIANLSGVRAISAGQYHSLAIDTAGNLWVWGRGPVGDGTASTTYEPTLVLTGVAQAAGGQNHTLAVKTDGSLWSWGDNSQGQLGDGTLTQRLVPTLVPGLSAIQAVVAGFNHSLAIGHDGSAHAWGDNDFGQLGNGTTTDVTAPGQVFAANTFAQGAPIPTIPGEPTDTEVRYYHTDAIGSVRMITNEAGASVARYDYLPSGQEWDTQSQVPWNRIRFTGQERDTETGIADTWLPLDYLGARYYQSQTGRFTRPDDPGVDQNPLDPQSWNLYSYVRNNPLRYVDPTGQKCENGYDAEKEVFCTETIGEDPYRRANEAWRDSQRFFLESWLNFERQFTRTSGFLEGSTQAVTTLFTSPAQSCYAQFAFNVAWSLNPADPAPGPEDFVAFGYAASKFNQALRYAASTPSKRFGTPFLVYANKSSTFRNLMKQSTRGTAVGFAAAGAASVWLAVYDEYQAASQGRCR